MTIPQAPGRFNKIAKLLNGVLAQGEYCQLPCESPKEATRIRFECYSYRSRLRKDLGPGSITPYDHLIIKIDGSTLTFTTAPDLTGKLVPMGKPLDKLEIAKPPEEDNAQLRLSKFLEYNRTVKPIYDEGYMWEALVRAFNEGEVLKAFMEAGLSPPVVL